MTSETLRANIPRGGEPLVEVSGLTRRYGKTTAVAGLDFEVRRGEAYGLLGPDGSGKTTTLRMLLGLVRPTKGTARLLGKRPGDPTVLRRVGALVGPPCFYPYLSGRDNLRVAALYAGVRAARADDVLEMAGLDRRAGDKVGGYSEGARRRLGVAAALLKDPELLILDEPTSGLGAHDAADVRELVRGARDGRTVLLCSRLVEEVGHLCDRAGVVREGRLLSELPAGELEGPEGLVVRAEPLEKALRVAETLPGVAEAWVEGEEIHLLLADPEEATAGEVEAQLERDGLRVSEVRPAGRSLEDVLLRLGNGEGARKDDGLAR